MVVPHIGEGVHLIHLLHGQRLRRGILHHISPLIGLHQTLSGKGIGVGILNVKALRVAALVPADLLEGGKYPIVVDALQGFRLVDSPVNEGDVLHVDACV